MSRNILGTKTSWHKTTCVYSSLTISDVGVAKLPFENVSWDLTSAESCPGFVWERAAWPEPTTFQGPFSQFSGTDFHVPVAGKVPECSSVYLAVTHMASSSVLMAIVLPKLMLEKQTNKTHKNLCLLIHGNLLLVILG